MSQKGILSFFKPINSEKKQNPLSEKNVNSPSKRPKLSSDEQHESEVNKNPDSTESKIQSDVLTGGKNTTYLTREQKDRIEKNRLRAKLKLLSKQFALIDPEMGITWFAALENEFTKPYFKELNDFVIEERKKHVIYPPTEDVWAWTKHCKVEDVKAVILGQDPYHGPGQAHGLCFSVPVGVTRPPSLVNIFKELKQCVKKEDYDEVQHGSLHGWAVQGVLLLNSVLTVRKQQANSHKDHGWEKLTTAVIKHIGDNNERVCFFLWGAYAQKKAEVVNPRFHLLLKSPHPSPLSASRGFFGCRHFKMCNNYLEKYDIIPIDWYWLPSEEVIIPMPTEPPIPLPFHKK